MKLTFIYCSKSISKRFSHSWDRCDLWNVVESHHIGPEVLHFLKVVSDEGWSWVGLHRIGKLNDVALLEPVLSVEVLLGESWGLRPLEAVVGCVQRFECALLIREGLEEIASIGPAPEPSEDPVEESVPLGHGKLPSEDVSELEQAILS